MSYIFSLPTTTSLWVFIAIGIFLYILGYFSLNIFSMRAKRNALSIPLPTFMGTIATAWALSLGFVAADIWIVNAKADQATSEERSAIARILGSAHVNVLNSDNLEHLIIDYRKTVMDDEWALKKNLSPSNEVDLILQEIRTEIYVLSKTDVPAPIISQIINDFDELQDARNLRLSVGATSVDVYKWYLLMSLTVLTLITVASVHADRKSGGMQALLLYTITSTLCFWILAIHANPYQGADPLLPSLLFTNIFK